MVRLNITMPEDMVKELSRIKNKSQFIAEALREKIRRDKSKELSKLLVEGYQKTQQEDKIVNKDWEKATLKGWS